MKVKKKKLNREGANIKIPNCIILHCIYTIGYIYNVEEPETEKTNFTKIRRNVELYIRKNKP